MQESIERAFEPGAGTAVPAEPARADVAQIERREIRIDQLVLIARNIPVAILANLTNSLLAIAFFHRLASPGLLGGWLALMLAFGAGASLLWWRSRDRARPQDAAPWAIHAVVLAAGAAGLLWGGFAAAIFPAHSVPHQVLLALAVGAMAATSLVSLQCLPVASATYILASLCPLILRFAAVGDAFHGFMTEMLAVYTLVLLGFTHNGYSAFAESVRLRLGNEELLRRMAATNRVLKRHVDELQWSRKRLVQQSKDLAKLAQAHDAERRRAESASAAKSRFLANMSHELRTPLNAIIGFSEMMRTEALGPVGSPRYRAYADDINRSGMHLLGLINDLLDLSKIEAGKMELAEGLLELPRLVDDCLLLLRDVARRGKVELAAELPTDLPLLWGDERKLKQVLLNLLGNAVKFTPEGGRVAVRAESERGGGFAIAVSDTGIGIAREHLAIVLEPFGQVRHVEGERAQPHGTGLGLPLSKALVELHGGKLEIESAPGRGTTIRLRLPPERWRAAAWAVA
ncbi:MAG TPA: ATP-binding protein [Stellaceae bacterium]|nr:ATP-binding protein [Stellaceae bacterium]